jgi:hypothetical protein
VATAGAYREQAVAAVRQAASAANTTRIHALDF